MLDLHLAPLAIEALGGEPKNLQDRYFVKIALHYYLNYKFYLIYIPCISRITIGKPNTIKVVGKIKAQRMQTNKLQA